jgi:hypothetical protein
MPATYVIYAFEISIAVALWLLVVNAWREGHRWLWTLLWGTVFGFAVEWWNTRIPAEAIYHYPSCAGENHNCLHPCACLLGVALWVPIGWGEILYLSTWTAQRLRIPRPAKPLAAAFLAVNFDLTLDPTAQALHLWTWNRAPVNLFGVPFDNFLGWYLIVSIYSYASRELLRKTTRSNGTRNALHDFLAAGGAAALSLLAYALIKYVGTRIGYDPSQAPDPKNPDHWGWQGGLAFIFVTVGNGVYVWWHAIGSRRDREVNWMPLIVPAYFHLLCLVLMLVSKAWMDEPAIVLAIPTNLTMGLILYAWPSLETLMRSPGRRAPISPHSRGPRSQHGRHVHDPEPGQSGLGPAAGAPIASGDGSGE